MTFVFVGISCFLLVVVFYLIGKIIKLARTIMAFEDNHSDAIEDYHTVIEILLACEEQLQAVIDMPIFFENEELRKTIDEAKQTTIVSRINVRKCVEAFIFRTKDKNIGYEEVIDEEDIYNIIENRDSAQYQAASNQIEKALNKSGVNTVFGRTS